MPAAFLSPPRSGMFAQVSVTHQQIGGLGKSYHDWSVYSSQEDKIFVLCDSKSLHIISIISRSKVGWSLGSAVLRSSWSYPVALRTQC